jgi:hypothetical protein
MTAAKTNYGVILGKQDTTTAYVTIGELVAIDPPEMIQGEIESTNHGSGGKREFISSMLGEVSSFKATVNYIKANIATLYSALTLGTNSRYQVAFDSLNAMQFGAIVTGIKPLGADAKSPDVLQAEITFRPTDSTSISS